MGNGKWGHCRTCRHFGSRSSSPPPDEEARCMHPELSKYELRVIGSTGCNGWELRPGVSEEAPPPA